MLRKIGSRQSLKAQETAIAADGGAKLMRKEVAQRLGIAETSVRRLEGAELRPIRRGRFVYFDAHEVERYAAEHTQGRKVSDLGEIAAKAFELFRDGKDFRDVVIELRQTPERVRQLYREYRLGSDLLLPATICRAIERMGFGEEGRPLCAEDVLRVIQGLEESNRRLIQKTIDQAQQLDELHRATECTATQQS